MLHTDLLVHSREKREMLCNIEGPITINSFTLICASSNDITFSTLLCCHAQNNQAGWYSSKSIDLYLANTQF
jgi:hypothetical protein